MVNSVEILMRLVGNGVLGTPLSMPAGTVVTVPDMTPKG